MGKLIFDLSWYQSRDAGVYLDWDRIAEVADGVILKIGENGSFEESFEEHLNNAAAVGLDVGVYYYTRADNEEDATDDAYAMAGWIDEYFEETPALGIWYDIENADHQNADNATAICNTWIDSMFCLGYKLNEIGIYGYWLWLSSEGEAVIDVDALTSDVPIWIAQYNSNCDILEDTPAYNVKLWQFTDHYSDEFPFDASTVIE